MFPTRRDCSGWAYIPCSSDDQLLVLKIFTGQLNTELDMPFFNLFDAA